MRNHYIELASRKVSDLKGVIAYYEEVLKKKLLIGNVKNTASA